MYEDISDFFRNGFPYYLLVILIICNPVIADKNNFNIKRMVQYDVGGQPVGCRASAINMEAKSLTSWSFLRHCVITSFKDMTIDQFRDIRTKAGGLIVMLPKDIASLSMEEKEHMYLLEQAMLAQEISIPVYFSKYDEDINKIIKDIGGSTGKDAKQKETAMNEIFNKVSANGYQVTVSGASHQQNKNSKIPIIQGELIPFKQTVKTTSEDGQQQQQQQQKNLPLIIVTANLKTFGLTNEYPANYDSTILLTLIDSFSKLYHQVHTTPKYRLLFLLTESGSLLNFQGSKKWLEQNLEENAQILNAEFVICLDTFAENPGNLFMHVSKPPKEGTHVNKFYQILKKKSQFYSTQDNEKTMEGVHKKINLADTFLAWPHERFSMKRMSAFTLSSVKTHTEPQRTTIFTDHSSTATVDSESNLNNVILDNIEVNTKIVAESLAAFIFNFADADESPEEIFVGPLAITQQTLKPYIGVESMAKSLTVKMAFEKYLKNVKQTYDKPDLREPDFMFYEGDEAKLNVYNVKPAVFDLFLTCMIAAYLFGIFALVQHFPMLYDIICKLTYTAPIQSNGNGVSSNHKVKSN